PPKITSPSMMLTSGTRPPSGVNESCQLLIAPQLASVVTVAKSAELAMPNRHSFPSMFPPDDVAVTVWSAPAVVSSGLPRASAQYAAVTPARNRNAIAPHTAQPCLGEPVICPSVHVSPAEIAKMQNSSKKLVSGVGFSNGWALLALKKPPPLVPTCLMISCDATGPCAIACSLTTVVCGLPAASGTV